MLITVITLIYANNRNNANNANNANNRNNANNDADKRNYAIVQLTVITLILRMQSWERTRVARGLPGPGQGYYGNKLIYPGPAVIALII